MSLVETQGFISIWAGLEHQKQSVDLLKDLCGVDFYDVDFMECSPAPPTQFQSVESLVKRLSYSESFGPEVCTATENLGLHQIAWLVMLLNHSFVPSETTTKSAESVHFLGVFQYTDND